MSQIIDQSYYEKNKDVIKKKVIERRKANLLNYKNYQHAYYLRKKQEKKEKLYKVIELIENVICSSEF
jgi:hypothetical protein